MRLLTVTLLLITSLICSVNAFSNSIKVKPTYQLVTFEKGANGEKEAVHMVNSVEIKHSDADIEIYRTDSSFWYWAVKGQGYTGVINLEINQETGVYWNFNFNGATIKAAISASQQSAFSPGLISLTTSINNFIYYLENKDSKCNSYFVFYQLPGDHDPDVEFNGSHDLSLSSSDPCADGKWKVDPVKKRPVDARIRTAAVFTAVMAINVRYLVKNYIPKSEE